MINTGLQSALQSALRSSTSDGAAAAGVALAFHGVAPDANNVMQGVLVGTGGLTEARTSTIYAPDHEDIWREFGSGEVAWADGRVVENILPAGCEDFTDATWTGNTNITVTSGISDPDGGSNAYTLTADATTSFIRLVAVPSADNLERDHRVAVYVRRRTGTGNVLVYDCASTGSTSIQSVITGSWQRVAMNVKTSSTGDNYFGFVISTSGDEIDVYQPMVESVGGQAITAPSDYIAPGTKKVYSTTNGNTVTSNVVTEAAGSALSPVPSIYYAPAATNDVLQNRDFTTSWSTSGGLTTAQDQVGITGEANTAWTLDDPGASSAYIFQNITVTDNSDTHVFRIRIGKDSDTTRFPGLRWDLTGGSTPVQNTVRVNTQTGGTYQSSGSDNFEVNDEGSFWEVLLEVTNNSTGNVTLRIILYPAQAATIDGAADASLTGSIVVDAPEYHLDKTIPEVRGSGPIFTTTAPVSVNDCQLYFDLANHDQDSGAYYCEHSCQASQAEGTRHNIINFKAGIHGPLYWIGAGNFIAAYDQTNSMGINPGPGVTAGQVLQLAQVYSTSENHMQLNADGTYNTSGAYDGGWDTSESRINVISNDEGIIPAVRRIRNVRRYSGPSVADLKATIDGLMP